MMPPLGSDQSEAAGMPSDGECPYAEMDWCCAKRAGHDGPHESAPLSPAQPARIPPAQSDAVTYRRCGVECKAEYRCSCGECQPNCVCALGHADARCPEAVDPDDA